MRAFFTLLGLSFAAAGASKLVDQRGYDKLFHRWGWSTREMQLVGLSEIVGGLLVASPRTRRIGATMLTATSGTVLSAELRRGDGEMASARGAMLLAALAAFLPYRQA
jgi:uncharacterized membrane protein YphA (DoxX/SURF4 family)